MVSVAVGDAKARVEDDLARVQEALAIAEEARRKVEAETSHLKIKRMSLLLELGVAKNEVSSIHSQVGKDKEAMDEDHQKALKLIFAYGYQCCVFKHNTCRDQPEVSNGMPYFSDLFLPEFFANPRCPPAPTTTEVTVVEVDQGETTKEHKKSASVRNQS